MPQLPKDLAPVALLGTRKPLGVIAEARVRTEPCHEKDLQWANMW
jgi:hypothetical protein